MQKLKNFRDIYLSEELIKNNPTAGKDFENILYNFGVNMNHHYNNPDLTKQYVQEFIENLKKCDIRFPITIIDVVQNSNSIFHSFSFITADNVNVDITVKISANDFGGDHIKILKYNKKLFIKEVYARFFEELLERTMKLQISNIKIADILEKDLKVIPTIIEFETEDSMIFAYHCRENDKISLEEYLDFSIKTNFEILKNAKEFYENLLKFFENKMFKNSTIETYIYKEINEKTLQRVIKSCYVSEKHPPTAKYAETFENGLTLMVTSRGAYVQWFVYKNKEWVTFTEGVDHVIKTEYPEINLMNMNEFNVNFEEIQSILKENLPTFLRELGSISEWPYKDIQTILNQHFSYNWSCTDI